jgi:hypothetical protein
MDDVRRHYIESVMLGCRANSYAQMWQPYTTHMGWGRLVSFGLNTFAASRGLPLPFPGERHTTVTFTRIKGV